MSFLFYVDVGALIVAGVVSSALFALSVGAGIRSPVNRCFALFSLAVIGWAISFITLRISFLTGMGNPQMRLWFGAMFFILSAPLLFTFALHYKRIHKKLHDLLVIGGFAASLAVAIPMFSGKLVSEPGLAANGATVMAVQPISWLISVVPGAFFIGTFVVLWRKRNDAIETYIAVSPLLLLAGLILDGLFSLPFPYLSLSGAVGCAVLGHGVTRRQVFNPLRKLTSELEEEVRRRTLELEQSHLQMEKVVDERTAELRQEIEDRKRTEAELRESEQKFRTFSEQSPNMIFINKRGKVVYANTRCVEQMGYTREEFLADGFDFRTLIAPESLPIIERSFAKHAAGEDVEPYEYTLITKDGKQIDAIIQTRLIDYENEQAILGIVTDIRNQKRSERLLQTLTLAALDLERALKPHELEPIAHRYLMQIGYFARVFWESEDGKAFKDMINEGSAHLLPESFPRLLKMLENREAELLREEDVMYPTLVEGVNQHASSCNSAVVIPFVAEKQGRGFMVVLGDDIRETEVPPLSVFANQLAASYRRSRLMDELGASVGRLKHTQEELAHAQRMEAIGRLSGGIAHDFNNILTAIHGCAELINIDLADESSKDAERHVEEIKRAVRKAAGLTQQLLAFSRKQVIERHETELNTVIRNFENLLTRVLGEDIDFALELGQGLGTVSLDERQFEQVLMNLAVNARDAMPHGGKITVRTLRRTVGEEEATERDFKPGPYCVLAFSDTGIGMDSETRRRVFEPFFTTKEFGKGTGLGMSTVYGIVRQCDGYIVVESEPERGTTYIIYLPETGTAPVINTHIDMPQESITRGGETVLVVEDDETVRMLTGKTLEKNGYSVFTANDAAEAMKICRDEHQAIDVVLTDVIMPGDRNGFELADWISENYPEIKVMYMSGYADEAGASREAIRENSAFLRKPFSSKALLETLREVCEGNTGIE